MFDPPPKRPLTLQVKNSTSLLSITIMQNGFLDVRWFTFPPLTVQMTLSVSTIEF